MEEFKEQLVTATQAMVVGDPNDEKTTVGATIHEQHAKKVLEYIQEARDQVKGMSNSMQI